MGLEQIDVDVLHDPFLMPDMDLAVSRIFDAQSR